MLFDPREMQNSSRDQGGRPPSSDQPASDQRDQRPAHKLEQGPFLHPRTPPYYFLVIGHSRCTMGAVRLLVHPLPGLKVDCPL